MPQVRIPIRGIADIEAIERASLEQQNDIWSLYELIVRGASIDLDRIAFYCLQRGDPDEAPETVTYRQLVERINKAANLFRSLGVTEKDAVGILLPIVPHSYYTMLGALTAGIASPLNWMLEPEQIASLLNATRAKVLVALGPSAEFNIHEKVIALRDRVPSLQHVLQVKSRDGTTDPARDFDVLCERHSGAGLEFTRRIDPGDDAFYIQTGGTTGAPKIARLVHRGVAYKCWAYSLLLDQQASHTVFAASPLFHVGGIVYGTMSALARGMTSVLLGPLGFRTANVVQNYWKLVERYRITDLFGVPTVLSALANVPIDADISSLRPYTMTGSAGLPGAIANHFAEKCRVRILSNYGMTENTATITVPPRDGEPRFGSSGIRLPFTEVRTVVIDENATIQRDCKPDEIGEIIIRGPGVIPGYLDETLNTTLFLAGGWLRTGDLGRLDADRYLWVTGRTKDLIIRGGHNIDPSLIEQTLMSHGSIALVAAVGKPDSYAGELPIAFVRLKPGACVSAEELKDYARKRIPERAAAPVDIFIVDAMPLTGIDKIFKPELRLRAARRVFADIVDAIAGTELNPAVEVAAHPFHGTLVTITLSRTDRSRDDRVANSIDSALAPFTYAHEIAWRPDAEPERTVATRQTLSNDDQT
ncbi:MAG: acyl-CoA synthetase [Xanthobacteraceae bacterium]